MATSAPLAAFVWILHFRKDFWPGQKLPVPLDLVKVYTARHTAGDVESIDVETIQPRQVQQMVRIGAAESAEPKGGKPVDDPGEVLLTAKRNLNRCAAELPDFRGLEGKKGDKKRVDDPFYTCGPAAEQRGLCGYPCEMTVQPNNPPERISAASPDEA